MSDRGDAVRRLVASLEKDEQETKTVRADLEALQAAVRGLTGREGTVSEMVTDLASVGRAVDDATIALAKEQSVRRGAVEARDKAIADREALEARIQVAQVALDAVRLAWTDEDAAPLQDALDRLDRALRGVPAVDRGRQGERFHAEVAPDRPSGSLQDRLAEVERRLTISEEMHTAHADHFGLLDQRVAGIGNRLDEARRPKVALFATERGDLRAYCDRGDQVGGVTRRDDVWDWYSRRPFEAPTAGYDVPTREAAIAAMRAVLSTWAEIVDGAPPAAAERQEAAELSPSGRDAGAFGSNSR